MGVRVGIFDAYVYGPSFPTMVSLENHLLETVTETRSIIPVVPESVLKALKYSVKASESMVMVDKGFH
jgi:Mrp family chromosome partitioning ATPase